MYFKFSEGLFLLPLYRKIDAMFCVRCTPIMRRFFMNKQPTISMIYLFLYMYIIDIDIKKDRHTDTDIDR